MSGRVLSVGSGPEPKFFQSTLNADKIIAFSVAVFVDVNGFNQAQEWVGNSTVGIDPETFSFDPSTGVLTLKKTGNYHLSYSLLVSSTSNTRHESEARLMMNTGSGFSEIIGTRSKAYHRNVAINGGNLAGSIFLKTTTEFVQIKIQTRTVLAADKIIESVGSVFSAILLDL